MTYPTALFKRIEAEKQLHEEDVRRRTLATATDIVKMYFDAIPLKSLYITGSVLQPNRFKKRSDIDIAVEGLADDKYFSAISELEELLHRNVEIIELEHCAFADKIRTSGLKLR